MESPAAGGSARVLLADDDETFILSTAVLLQHLEGYDCELARDASEAIQILGRTRIDAMLLDINMPGNEDMQLFRHVRAAYPLVPVIVITGYPSVPTAVQALRLTAADYLTKPFPHMALRDALQRVLAGGSVVRDPNAVLDGLPPPLDGLGDDAREALRPVPADGLGKTLGRLSGRERQVLAAVIGGHRVAAIAREFGLSTHTIRNHLKSIFRKTGVHSQLELVGRLR